MNASSQHAKSNCFCCSKMQSANCPARADGGASPGEGAEGAADLDAVTAGVRLQAARLAHQQEQANYERRLAADHLAQRRVLKQAATAALAAGARL